MPSVRVHVMKLTLYSSVILALLGAVSCGRKEKSAVTPAVKKAIPVVPKKPSVAGRFERPKSVRGLYVTAWVAGGQKRMDQLIQIADTTEINAMVIDLRDDGEMYVKTGLKLADEAKATHVAIVKPKEMLDKLKSHNIWPIARIACFRDHFVPLKHPELAVQVAGGQPWKDRSGHMWLDPYNQKNWDYLAELVDHALDMGFPEIQLDYVRFPSEGKSQTQVFPAKGKFKDPKAAPEDVIAEFATFIGKRVRERGAEFSADIFGIISSSKSDQGIGQFLEKVAGPFDTLSPMIYPSHFHKGEYGIPDPDLSPYAIVHRSLLDYQKRLPSKRIRPWLQDFSLGNHYGPEQVKAQIKAAHDVGYNEYLLWNAGNKYSVDALAKETQK